MDEFKGYDEWLQNDEPKQRKCKREISEDEYFDRMMEDAENG